jgi:hypothetical protein
METMNSSSLAGVEEMMEWAWVAGYSSLSTLVIIFNSLLFFSVAKNSYLHYSTHYTILALAFRWAINTGSTTDPILARSSLSFLV